MRYTAVSGVVLVVALTTPVFGQSFLGRWTATAKTPGGDVSESLTVVKTDDGYTITAKLVAAALPEGVPEAGPGTDIVLDGDTFFYKRTVTIPEGTLEITYTGVVSGDTFTGTVDLGGVRSGALQRGADHRRRLRPPPGGRRGSVRPWKARMSWGSSR